MTTRTKRESCESALAGVIGLLLGWLLGSLFPLSAWR